MASQEKLTADLFEVDKRLSLKPVADFNAYLRAAFGDGACTCVRCQQSGGLDAGYTHRHTFEFDGAQGHRRFANTSASDVLLALKKAWLSYTKADLPLSGNLDLDTLRGFVEPALHNRLLPLLSASGLARAVEGGWVLVVPDEA
ncbi:hypothetical protein [Pseudomonas sp. RIT-PI-S]|uniref:hypothetical protein n=1 Tax=Pseudomonas sp. RIT-PI-S TaxID=3035295 RepID=UPI0021D8807F|nr:hypothetical protein [Pseudomonas sp. RIT-PI-S]